MYSFMSYNDNVLSYVLFLQPGAQKPWQNQEPKHSQNKLPRVRLSVPFSACIVLIVIAACIMICSGGFVFSHLLLICLNTCLMVPLPALSVILACVLMYSVWQQWLKVPQCHDPCGLSSSWSRSGGCLMSDWQFSWSDWLTEWMTDWLSDQLADWTFCQGISLLLIYSFIFSTVYYFLFLSLLICFILLTLGVHTHFPVSWLYIKIVQVSFRSIDNLQRLRKEWSFFMQSLNVQWILNAVDTMGAETNLRLGIHEHCA